MDEEEFSDLLSQITGENKTSRKRGFEKVLKIVEKEDLEFSDEQREELMRIILRSLSDKYERCREVCCELCLAIFTKIPKEEVQKTLPFLFQVFARRLSIEEEYEPSEEVRMKMMELLNSLMELFTTELQVYAEDLVDILVSTLEDKCPEVKKISAVLVVKLTEHHKKVMRLKGSSLAGPLARNISHRQSGVRAVTVTALGHLVLATDGAVFESLASHCAQRVFDPSPQVRLRLVETLGSWLVGMPDRYSYWHKIVPLLLVTFRDEMAEVSSLAERLWAEAGSVWLEENKMSDSRLKDELDFLTAEPQHYPAWLVRPGLGCRTLAARIQHQVYPSINNDLKDWQVDTRVKAIQLMYVMLYHSEVDIVMHTEKVMSSLVMAGRDEEEKVREMARKCSVILGYMLQPTTWQPFILQRLRDDASSQTILVLAGLLEGTDREVITEEELEQVVVRLADDEVCCTRDEETLAELAAFCLAVINLLDTKLERIVSEALKNIKATDETLLDSKQDDGSESTESRIVEIRDEEEEAAFLGGDKTHHILCGLVKILLAVESLSSDPGLVSRLRGWEERLAGGGSDVWRAALPSLLAQYLISSPGWTQVSPQLQIFRRILTQSGAVTGHFPRTVLAILTNLCSGSDPNTRLQSFIILSRLLLNLQDTLDSQGTFSPCIVGVVRDIVAPALKWEAGRTASAIRTAACSSLWSSILASAASPSNLISIFQMVEARVLGLLADESLKTRMFSLKSLTILFTSHVAGLTTEFLVKSGVEISDLLNDSESANREESVRCLGAFLHYCADTREVEKLSKTVSHVITNLTLHMDDDSEGLRDLILGCLITLPVSLHQAVAEQVEKSLLSHRHTDHLNTLLNTVNKA